MKKKTRKIIEAHLRSYNKNLNEDEAWNNIIKNRLDQMNDEEIELVKMRYFKRKKINYITYELYMSRNKYFSKSIHQTLQRILTGESQKLTC